MTALQLQSLLDSCAGKHEALVRVVYDIVIQLIPALSFPERRALFARLQVYSHRTGV